MYTGEVESIRGRRGCSEERARLHFVSLYKDVSRQRPTSGQLTHPPPSLYHGLRGNSCMPRSTRERRRITDDVGHWPGPVGGLPLSGGRCQRRSQIAS